MEHLPAAPSFVGIDVSKDRLDVHILPTGQTLAVQRNEKGFEDLVSELRKLAPALIALEATGGLEVAVAAALASANPGGVGGPGSTYHDARKLCAQHTPEAIHKQIELMRTCDDPRVVTIVTQAIIDRGAGKPRDYSNEQTQRVDTSVLTPEKREALAALLREAMGLQ
jgi:hypothetical protein